MRSSPVWSVLLWSKSNIKKTNVFFFVPPPSPPSSTFLYCVQCTQGAKELLESASHSSSVVKSSCSSATPKTTSVTQDNLLTVVSSTHKSPSGKPSTSCFGRQKHHLTDKTCPQQTSKKATPDAQAVGFHLSLYSVNHSSLILSDASDMGFLPLTWV